MKNIIYSCLFFIGFITTYKTVTLPTNHSKNSSVSILTATETQKKILFKELLDSGLYLGMSKKDYLKIRPNAEYNSDVHDFRSIYVEEKFSTRFETLICYIDNDNEQLLYEFILILNPSLNANDIASKHFGLPNKGTEWRFPPSETNLSYTIAAWTYKNKIIIAATIKDTEWENGID
jgi:hypothetical protein